MYKKTIDRTLLMDRSVNGRRSFEVPVSDVPNQELPEEELLRSQLSLPELSQLEII